MPNNRDYDNIIEWWKKDGISEYKEKQDLFFLLS
jgi:hypothetical protein